MQVEDKHFSSREKSALFSAVNLAVNKKGRITTGDFAQSPAATRLSLASVFWNPRSF